MHSLIAGIANSFTDNLIAEQRYRMILDGLQVTLLITFCAAVLGTLLGGVVCWARMSRKPLQCATIYTMNCSEELMKPLHYSAGLAESL